MSNVIIFSLIVIASEFGWLFGLAINEIISKVKDKKAKKKENK